MKTLTIAQKVDEVLKTLGYKRGDELMDINTGFIDTAEALAKDAILNIYWSLAFTNLAWPAGKNGVLKQLSKLRKI